MADTEYVIRLVDKASAAARKVDAALASTARAAQRTSDAFQTQDRAYRKVASEAERLSRVNLKLARSEFSVASAAMRNARAMDRLKGATRGAATATHGLGAAAVAVGAVMAGRVAAGALTAGVALIKARGEADLLRDTFNRVAGNKTEFPKIQQQIRALGLDLVEGEKAALKLRAVFGGVTTGKFLQFFKATNLDADEVKRASLALSQIAGRGKLQGEELNQFAEAVPGFNRGKVIESISKSLKISLAAASKKLQSGQVSANVGIRALFEGGLKSLKINDLEKQLKIVENSTTTRLARMQNNWTDAKRDIGKALETGPLLGSLEGLSGGLAGVTKWLGPDGLKGAFEIAGIGLGAFTTVLAGAGLKALFTSIAAGATAASAPLLLIAGSVGAAAGAIYLLIKAVQQFNALGGLKDLGTLLGGGQLGATANIGGVPDRPRKKALDRGLGLRFATGAGFGMGAAGAGLNLGAAVDPGRNLDFQTAATDAEGLAIDQATKGLTGPSRMAIESAGAGAGASVSNRKGGVQINKIEVPINIQGAGDPAAVGASVADSFDQQMQSIFERHAEGVGA